jgi:hypothetical protein
MAFENVKASFLEDLTFVGSVSRKGVFEKENMPRRELLTSAQREVLLAFPTEEAELLRHYKRLAGHTCAAMKGLIEEGSEWIGEDAEAEVMDAGIIAAAPARLTL